MKMKMVLKLGMMLMMILMMLVTMVMTMNMISPSGRCSPRRNLPVGDDFSLLLVSATERRRNSRKLSLLGFLDDVRYIGQSGDREWPQGSRHPPDAARVGAR